MGTLDKVVKLATAAPKRNKFRRDSINVTTNDYFFLKPVFSREMVPKQSTTINMSVFSRLAPMVDPAYARCKFVNRCFFVPYRTIFKDFNRFIAQEKNEQGVIIQRVPMLQQTTIFSMFLADLQADTSYFVQEGQDDDYDLNYNPDFEHQYYMKFTYRGKIAYDTLINLGYNIPYLYDIDMDQSDKWNVQYSALPLLALLKVWFDWYRNNKYEPLILSNYAEKYFTYGNNAYVSADDLKNILLFITQISYPQDYFTSASANPVTPAVGEPGQTIADVTMSAYGTGTNNTTDVKSQSAVGQGTPALRSGSNTNSAYNITQFILNALNKMTDYMQRDGLVGGKTLDRLMAHYGVRLPSEMLNRSVFVGKYEQAVNIMDVTQTSASDGENVLGLQAGRGHSQGEQGKFEFDTDEFGQIIILSQVLPEVSYYQGVKREMMHLNRFDFYTQEYDSLGCQPICVAEIYNGVSDLDANPNPNLSFYNEWDKIFAFQQSRYAEYKQSSNQDVLSGDFRVNLSGRRQLRHYHQFRQITKDTFSTNVIKTEKRFDEVGADCKQYDRIFNSNAKFDDHFISFYNFEVLDFMPMRPLFESYDFGDDDEHNPKMSISKGGTMF